MRTIDLHTSRKQFEALRGTRPDLALFADPCAVLDFLHRRDTDRDAKDRILAALVRETQGDGVAREVAVTLMWLALWPGLDALYRRLWRHFTGAHDELVSEIAARFTAEMHRADLTRIHRVAATLIANVERDIRDGLRRKWAEASLRREMPDQDDLVFGARLAPSALGLPPGIDADVETDMIRAALTGLVGDDGEIVVAVVIMGECQRDIASRIGLSHDAVRKRYQRSLRRLRQTIEIS